MKKSNNSCLMGFIYLIILILVCLLSIYFFLFLLLAYIINWLIKKIYYKARNKSFNKKNKTSIDNSKFSYFKKISLNTTESDIEDNISNKINTNINKNTVRQTTKKRELSEAEIERFAIICNNYLSHQDKLENYNKAFSRKDNTFETTTTNDNFIQEKTESNEFTMTGENFEKYCANLLSKNGFTNIHLTKASGDQGVDIIATKDYVKYAIQCKCYSTAVGNRAVQEVYAGKNFYNAHIAVVMTNQSFTESARELAQKNNVLLWDKTVLNNLLSNAK